MIRFLIQALCRNTSKRRKINVQTFLGDINWSYDVSDEASKEVAWAFAYYPELYLYIDSFILAKLEESNISSQNTHEFIRNALKKQKDTSCAKSFRLIHYEKNVLCGCIGNMNSADERENALLNHLVIGAILSQKKKPNAELLELGIKAILPSLKYYYAVTICEKALLLLFPEQKMKKVFTRLKLLFSDQGEKILQYINYLVVKYPCQQDMIADIVATQLKHIHPSSELFFPRMLIKALKRGMFNKQYTIPENHEERITLSGIR